MDDQDKKKQTGKPASQSGWWARCRNGMKETWKFTKNYTPKTAGTIGKLYYLSLATGWVALGAGIYGVPGAPQASIAAFGVAKGIKLLWDQVRDIQDATEDIGDTTTNPEERLNETDARIRELEEVIADQQEVIASQYRANENLRSTHSDMINALSNSTARIAQLEDSHQELKCALFGLMREREGLKPHSRESLQNKYQEDIRRSIGKGDLSNTTFNSQKDNLATIEDTERSNHDSPLVQ